MDKSTAGTVENLVTPAILMSTFHTNSSVQGPKEPPLFPELISDEVVKRTVDRVITGEERRIRNHQSLLHRELAPVIPEPGYSYQKRGYLKAMDKKFDKTVANTLRSYIIHKL